MTIVAVEFVPEPKRKKKNEDLQAVLELFANSNAQVVRVEDDEGTYASPYSLYSALYVAVSSFKHPVRAVVRNGEVYLEKIT